jgi:hypothetical protein
MTNFLAVCEELVAALDPKVVLTDGYGPITSFVLRIRAILTNSNNSMTKDLPEYGTLAYCASKFVDYPPMTDQFPDATKKVLSPAAQAVLTAVTQQEYCLDPSDIPNEAGRIGRLMAAALRAAANQVVPHPGRYPMNEYMEGLRDCKQDFRAALLGIADELEAQ